LDFRHHRGHGDRTHRQDLLPEQVIQKTALPGLEAAKERNAEHFLRGESSTAFDEII
jgi:hypothetical protein